jgi:hypothetical protein
MKKLALAIALAGVACTGCTTVALTEYTRQQISAAGDCRDEAVLNCLATVAADPDILPSYGLYSAGITTFTDSAAISHTVTWAPLANTLEVLALSGSRSPRPQWTFDPTVEYEKLQAMHAACLWAVCGEERAKAQYPEILGSQEEFLDQKPHFAVEYRLRQIPPGWLHVGCAKDVPACVRYKAKKDHRWVWIMPEDHEAFAQFTLTLQDIATQDVSAYYSPPIVMQLTTSYVTKVPDPNDKTKATTINTNEFRTLKPQYKQAIENLIQTSLVTGKPIQVTRAQWLEYTDLYTGVRSSATGTPATSLSARAVPAGPTLTPQGNSTLQQTPKYVPN